MENVCWCDGEPMFGSDHCPVCFCEENEERCHVCWKPFVFEHTCVVPVEVRNDD
jgi:hypothetical protein